MNKKEIKERVNNQIELASEILELLDTDGHDHDISLLDILDEIASAGVELVPLKDINVAFIAYLSLVQNKKSIDYFINQLEEENEKASSNTQNG